jgi:AMP deaminase
MVIFRDGKNLSLKAVFESLKLSSHELSVDTLDVHVRPNANHFIFHTNLTHIRMPRPTKRLSIDLIALT